MSSLLVAMVSHFSLNERTHHISSTISLALPVRTSVRQPHPSFMHVTYCTFKIYLSRSFFKAYVLPETSVVAVVLSRCVSNKLCLLLSEVDLTGNPRLIIIDCMFPQAD